MASDEAGWILPGRQLDAYVGLGYHLLPFQAFNANGEIDVPVQLPDEWSTPFADAQAMPIWSEIQRALNLLGDEDYACYAVGIDFLKDGFRIMPAKALNSIQPSQAGDWIDAVNAIVIDRIEAVGGERPAIPDEWLQVLQGILGLLQPAAQSLPPSNPPTEDQKKQAAGFAVGSLLGLLNALAQFPIGRSVKVTNIWYREPTPFDGLPLTPTEAAAWAVLGPVRWWGGYFSGNRAMANIIWDPVTAGRLFWWDQSSADIANAYAVDYAAPGYYPRPDPPDPPKPAPPPFGTWGSGLPHQPYQITKAFYPLKPWTVHWSGTAGDLLRWVA